MAGRKLQALTLSGAAYFQDFNNTGNNPLTFSLNADYALSKRSRLYNSLGYVKNKRTSNLGFYDSGKSFGNTSPGQNQLGVVVGMRHIFQAVSKSWLNNALSHFT